MRSSTVLLASADPDRNHSLNAAMAATIALYELSGTG